MAAISRRARTMFAARPNPVPDQEIMRKLSGNAGRVLPRADVVRLSQVVMDLEAARTLESLTGALRVPAKSGA